MTVITHTRHKSRLSKMIDSAGGVSVGVALTRARQNLAELRPKALIEVNRHIEELAVIPAPVDAEDALRRLEQVYRAANGVIDAAHPFDLDDICAVALGLCDVIDRAAVAVESGAGASFDWRIIGVHAQSLRLLFKLPPEARTERAQVRVQLTEMVARKFPQAG